MREETINRTISALHEKGYAVTTFFRTNTCFDLIAVKGNKKLIVKIYENIDSIRKEQGEELRKLGSVLEANCVIIGKKTKVFGLENGVVYERYGIPVVTIGTFEKALENELPKVRHFKGKNIVEINFEKLREKREEMELSMDELSKKLGVASETLYRFEKGASTSLETAKKMEEHLHQGFVKEISLLGNRPEKEEFDEEPGEKLLERIRELGVKMALFRHSPFDAYGSAVEGIFISTGKGKFDIPRKAAELKKMRGASDADSIIIAKEFGRRSIDDVPIIFEEELYSISKLKDLKKMMREREENEK
ncbi:MAG: helix-turn-helix domain-containing protein [archaeon]